MMAGLSYNVRVHKTTGMHVSVRGRHHRQLSYAQEIAIIATKMNSIVRQLTGALKASQPVMTDAASKTHQPHDF